MTCFSLPASALILPFLLFSREFLLKLQGQPLLWVGCIPFTTSSQETYPKYHLSLPYTHHYIFHVLNNPFSSSLRQIQISQKINLISETSHLLLCHILYSHFHNTAETVLCFKHELWNQNDAVLTLACLSLTSLISERISISFLFCRDVVGTK